MAVVVGIDVNVAADARRFHFGEIVVDAVVAAVEIDAAEDIDGRHDAASGAVDRARRIADAQIPVGLGLHDSVRVGCEVVERVVSVGVGRGGQPGGHVTAVVQTEQRQGDAGDARLAGVVYVVNVEILVHGAGKRDRQRRLRCGCQNAGCEHRFRRDGWRHVRCEDRRRVVVVVVGKVQLVGRLRVVVDVAKEAGDRCGLIVGRAEDRFKRRAVEVGALNDPFGVSARPGFHDVDVDL